MSASNYVVPYSMLLKQIGVSNGAGERVELRRDQLLLLIRRLVSAVSVDDVWYKKLYQDVEEAIQSGAFKSAKDHFVSNGYFEGRLPSKIVVDEAFYVSRYPDVAEGIDDGEINSAQEHFETHGFSEGRLPFEP